MVTDGMSNINEERTLPEARRLKQDGVIIAGLGIGLGNKVLTFELLIYSVFIYVYRNIVIFFDIICNVIRLIWHAIKELQGQKVILHFFKTVCAF